MRNTKLDGSYWGSNPLGLQPLWPDKWDPAASAKCHDDGIYGLEALPAFSGTMPDTHFKALMFGQPVAVPETGLRVEVEMAVECIGTEKNPFGLDAGDPRLAAGAFNLVDFSTGLVFDFFVSNSKIWVLYERVTSARATLGPYPAFTSFHTTEATTAPGEWHLYELVYDRHKGIVEYWCDRKKVFEVENIGPPPGGSQPIVRPSQFSIGAGIFVVLDSLSNDLESADDNPKIPGAPMKTRAEENFGQGTRVLYRNFRIR